MEGEVQDAIVGQPAAGGNGGNAPLEFALGCDWWVVGFTNSAAIPPQKSEDFRGFQAGGLIAQVARFGEKGAGESRFRLSLRLRIRQPMRKNGGKPALHGAGQRGGDWLVQVEVASRTDASNQSTPAHTRAMTQLFP